MRITKKTIYGLILAALLILNLFLTLQSPEGTVGLSEGLRLWLEQFGFHSDFHSFRSNAHLVMYFVLGVALTLYGREGGWKWWMIILLGCGIGVIDEGIKVLLPTREFDVKDFMRDFVGAAVGIVVTVGIAALVRRARSSRQNIAVKSMDIEGSTGRQGGT